MHEIRATVPPELTEEAARLAHEAGIERVSIAEVFMHGPGLTRRIVSADTSTPKARAFVDALLNSPAFSGVDYTVTSREVRSIVSNESPNVLTRPMSGTVHRRYPGSLANEPCHDQLCGSGGCRGRSARDRNHRRQPDRHRRRRALPALSLAGARYQLWTVEPGPRAAFERRTGCGREHRAGNCRRCGRRADRRRHDSVRWFQESVEQLRPVRGDRHNSRPLHGGRHRHADT